MIDTQSDWQMPADLRDAFDRAVIELVDWHSGGDEPTVSFDGEPVSISGVFRMALPFEEPMPEVIFQDLIAYAARSLERETDGVELSKDRSYASGARCLLGWVRENNSKFFGT
jgi:hypothetical protein